MADDVEEKDEEDWSEALAENPTNLETSKNTSKLTVSPSKNSVSPLETTAQIPQSTSKVNTVNQEKVSFKPNSAGERGDNNPKNPGTSNSQKPFKSDCHPRSRDVRQCQKHFQDIIGKHEIRNEELEQLEGDLRQRLQALESSMPAVMVWNIWRMAQGAPTSAVRRLMTKQFQGFGADNVPVPTTPSQHWDERIRKIEAERKEAVRRIEEARVLLAGKEAAVYEREKRLEEEKKCHQERKEMLEKLAREAAKQREALKNARGDDNSGKIGETGEIRNEKWLDAVGSVSSIGSTDLESFAKLQELAEAEICMKRQINELERREEAYMRTLQQADEMWSKMEGDTADTVSLLQDQLDLKTTANQQLADRICQLEDELENSKKKLISSKEALSKYSSKVFTEAKSGLDDSEADVKSRGVLAAVKTAPASATAGPETFDQESTAYPEKKDQESHVVAPDKSHVGIIAVPKTTSKTVEAVPVPVHQTHRGIDPVLEFKKDSTHRGVDPVAELERDETPQGVDAATELSTDATHPVVDPATVSRTDATHQGVGPVSQVRIKTPVGDDENIPDEWKNWNWDEGCPPDILCNDMVEDATGTEECQLDAGSKKSVKGQIAISPEELRNWYNIVDSLHHMIAKGEDCSSKTDDVAQLATQIKSHLRIKGVADVKGPMIMPEKILKSEVIPSEEHMAGVITPSVSEMQHEIKSAVGVDGVDDLKEATLYIPEDEKEIDTKPVPLVKSTEKMQEEIEAEVPTDNIDLHDPIEPHFTEVDANIGGEIVPLIPSTKEMQQEIKLEALTDDVELPDETGLSITEDVPEEEEITPPTQPTDETKNKIKTEDLIDHEDLGNETKSTIAEEVAKTDMDISLVSAARAETEPSDVLGSVEKDGRPEAGDLDLPAERAKTTDISATPVSADVETKPSATVDKTPAVTSQIDVSEQPAVADEKLPLSTKESPRVEEKAEDEIVAYVEDVKVEEKPGEIIYEETSSVAPTETMKEPEHELPDTEKFHVEPKQITDAEKIGIESQKTPDLEKVKDEPDKIPYSEEVKGEFEKKTDLEKVKGEPEKIPDSDKVKGESEKIPDSGKEEAEPEGIPDVEKVEDKVERIPDSKQEEVESAPISDAEKVKIEPTEIHEEQPTYIPESETPIEIPEELGEKAEETVPIPKDDELKFEDALELITQPEKFPPEEGEGELPLEKEVPTEEDATIEEAPPSFITLRTPPISTIDVRKKSKDEITAVPDLSDDQSAFDVIREKRSSEAIVGQAIEGLLLTVSDVPAKTKEPISELDIREPVAVEHEKPEKVSITKTIDYEERPEIIDAEEISELQVPVSKAQVIVKPDSETKPEIPKAGSQPDVKETERPEDKLAEDISTKEKITVDRPKAGKPYLVIAKVESWKKLELPKPVGPCICKPRVCPLPGRSVGHRAKLKVVEVVTSGTQTTSSIPTPLLGGMDKQKPKKLPERTRPSPLVAMWRRATSSPRRPKDKSTLTTVCVDTQTDSTLVRGRIALQGITRKDDCTCSGACPRKPDHGGCIQRISDRPPSEKRPVPVSSATAQRFSSTNFPMSVESCAEKEICVVKYTGTSFVSSSSHLDCVECGRPITPGGTVVSVNSTLPTTSTSQKSIMKPPKSMASSTSRVTHSKDGLTCCDCKTSSKLKTDDSSQSRRKHHKDFDKRRHEQDECCPCPPKVAKKSSSKISKKKRKPETKDQAVMANIPKSPMKSSSKEAKGIDVITKKSPHSTSLKIKPSDTGTKTISKIFIPGKQSYCSCDESSHGLNASGVSSITDSAKTPKNIDPCDCFSMEPVSKGSSCNCFQYNV